MNTPTPAAEPILLTVRETAQTLALCEKSLWNLRRSGRLRAVRIGRAIRFDRRDVLAFVEAAKDKKESTHE